MDLIVKIADSLESMWSFDVTVREVPAHFTALTGETLSPADKQLFGTLVDSMRSFISTEVQIMQNKFA